MSRCSFKAGAVWAAVLLTVFFLLPVRAAAQDTGYSISAFDVRLAVSADSTMDVTERITADFASPRHGILLRIPVSGTAVSQVDGRTVRTPYHNAVRDVSVTDAATGSRIPYSQSRENGNLELKIGDSRRLVTGEKAYAIHYRYLVGPSYQTRGYDELYYNLIGTGWDTGIFRATFAIQMPRTFDFGRLSFTAGAQGSAEESAVSYRVSGTAVTGQVTRPLAAGEGLTVRLQLPDGYFARAEPSGGTALTVLFGLMAAGSLLLFLRFGRDRRLYVPVEVSPPDDLNPAEAGYIVDGHADTRDVVSLLIYWADRGYLSISCNKKRDFTLHKLREPDSAMKSYEAKMFRRLFHDRDSVTSGKLRNSFYTTVSEVQNELAGSFLRADRRLYTLSGNRAKAACYLLAGLAAGILCGRAVDIYFLSAVAGWVAGAVCGILTILAAALVGYTVEKGRAGSRAGLVGSVLLYAVLLSAVTMISIRFSGLTPMCLAGGIAAAVAGIAGSYAKKRTPQGARWLGSLLGLRRFIQMAEKKRLEAMVEEDPAVFYHILPYAFVLGVTEKWAKQFDSIALPPPAWFDDETGSLFGTIYFCTLLNRNMAVYQERMVSMPQSNPSGPSGGSFSGGGGFTGGGMGGGGGSSW